MKATFFAFSFLIFGLFLACDKNSEMKEVCRLQPDPGNCFAAIPKYYFDQESGECKAFIWGGCNGLVPFETMEECEACDCK